LSENLTIVEYNNGKTGVLNDSTNTIVGIYDYVFHTSAYDDNENKRSVFVVVKDNLRGYISAETGEVIFEPQFLHAWIDDPESNLAACVNKDNKLGFVNVLTKETVIPFEFDYNKYADYVFHGGLCCVTKWQQDNEETGNTLKEGCIDIKGNEVIPVIFDYVEFFESDYIKVQKDGHYGLLDTLFNAVLPIEYDYIELYEDFSVAVELEGKYGYLERLPNGKYKIVLPIEYDNIDFNEQGIVATKDGIAKLYDNTGKKILNNFYCYDVEPLYEITDEVYAYDEEGDWVKKQETRKKSPYSTFYLSGYYGVIDTNFKLIIPAKYESVKYIGNGFFKCENSDYEFVIINSKGEIAGK
jgi:hypothetical protein